MHKKGAKLSLVHLFGFSKINRNYIQKGREIRRNMKRMKKVLSIVLSLAMILTSITVYNTKTAKAEDGATTEPTLAEMISDSNYNLALRCTVTTGFKSWTGENKIANLTNGKIDNARVYPNGQEDGWYQIDLGNYYTTDSIDQIVTVYNEINKGTYPSTGYEIQYSTDGITYYTAKSVNSFELEETQPYVEIEDMTEEKCELNIVRYIRFFYHNKTDYGIQVKQLSILNLNNDAEKVEMEKCGEAKAITLKANGYNSLIYNITPGDNQDGYKYSVYNGNILIDNDAQADVDNVVSNLDAGNYKLTVVASYDGKVSAGITSNEIEIKDISEMFSLKNNVTNINNNSLVNVIKISSFYSDKYTLDTAKCAVGGDLTTGEGSSQCIRTKAGENNQYVVIDLGQNYKAGQFKDLILGYTNTRTYATDTTVSFSDDNVNYEEVGKTTGWKCADDVSVLNYNSINKIPLSGVATYSKDAVRYIKIDIANGQKKYGYVLNEIGLIADSENPEIVEDVAYTATIDGEDATVENNVVVLPNTAKYGYYCEGKMYKAGKSVKLEGNMAFTSVNKLNLTITNGVSIRLVTGETGLRYKATITSDNNEAINSDAIQEGILITTQANYNDTDSNIEIGSDNVLNVANVSETNNKWYAEKNDTANNKYGGTFCGSIIKMIDSNIPRPFVARAYATIKYEGDSDATVIYTDVIGKKSIKDIAKLIQEGSRYKENGYNADEMQIIDDFAKYTDAQ